MITGGREDQSSHFRGAFFDPRATSWMDGREALRGSGRRAYGMRWINREDGRSWRRVCKTFEPRGPKCTGTQADVKFISQSDQGGENRPHLGFEVTLVKGLDEHKCDKEGQDDPPQADTMATGSCLKQ